MTANWTERELDVIPEAFCRLALREIRGILMDGSLEDEACFYRIEEIVCALEKIGMDRGGRHDF